MTEMLTIAGYWLAALLVATVPAAVLFWYLIHPFAAFWRRLGPLASYVIVGAVCLALAAWIFTLHESLLAVRYPFSWWLAIPGLALYAAAAVIEVQCRRQLKMRILVGGPEVGGAPGGLLTDGIYARTRNPRYLDILLGLTGWAMILNYRTLYLVVLGLVPAAWVLILLEEKELEARFGEPYRQYLRRVPRLIPRRR